MASRRCRINVITLKMVGISDNASAKQLNRMVMESFDGRFKSTKRVHVISWNTHFPYLDRMEAESLEVPFLEDEIRWELK